MTGPPTTTPMTKAEKITVFFLPNLADIVLLFIIQIPLFLRPSYVFGDGSTGWHLYTGDWILANHAIPYHNLFSYNMPDKAWVAYEWLSDVIMASLVKLGGLNLLSLCVSFSLAWLLVLLYQRCRSQGAHFLIGMLLMILANLLFFIHWLARPVIFAFYGVYIFSTRLEDFQQGRIGWKQMIIPMTLYMVLWVNTHPGFIFGFALIAIYLCANLLSFFFHAGTASSGQYLQKLKMLGAAFVCTFAASLLNPYFLSLYLYINQYLRGSAVLAANEEFASPVFHGSLQSTCLEVFFALFIVALAIGRHRLSFPKLLTCIAFCHLALSAVRNIPLLAIVLLPAIAQLFSQVEFGKALSESSTVSTEAEDVPQWRQKLVTKWKSMTAMFDENEALCQWHFWPIAMFVVLFIASLNGGKLLGNDLLSCNWSSDDKPTKTLDYLNNAEQKGELDPLHGFNHDNWGGYLLYRMNQNVPRTEGTPQRKVYMDDRSDFYGTDFYVHYVTIDQVQPGWQQELDKQKIQWLLVPNHSRIAEALSATPGWKTLAEDKASVLIARTSSNSPAPPNPHS
jgi:hypothetical protein